MTAGQRIRLVHWKEEEVPQRAARLEACGYAVDGRVPGTSIGIRALREDPPDAFVIDLGRLPSRGREVAASLRQSKALRAIPIVFAGGAAEKLDSIRADLPDATYADWENIDAALREALENPPAHPVVPTSSSGRQSGRRLADKLGVREGMTIVLLDAPGDAEQTLAPLPRGVALRRRNRGRRAMTIWFTTSSRELYRRFDSVATAVGGGTLWIAWPKRSSGMATDLTEDGIRAIALGREMVDTKVCAIDETWSGLRLTRRRS